MIQYLGYLTLHNIGSFYYLNQPQDNFSLDVLTYCMGGGGGGGGGSVLFKPAPSLQPLVPSYERTLKTLPRAKESIN